MTSSPDNEQPHFAVWHDCDVCEGPGEREATHENYHCRQCKGLGKIPTFIPVSELDLSGPRAFFVSIERVKEKYRG